MIIKGIIFDLDGTLVDTLRDISDSMNKVLEEEGFEKISYDDYRLKIGGGFKNLVKNASGVEEGEKFTRILSRLEEVYSENYLRQSKPYEGIEKLLEELTDRDISLAVNTNKNQDYSEKMIRQLFPGIDFVSIVGMGNGLEAKPDTRGVEIILERMNLNKDEVLFIGDSNVDILTGKNAGIRTVGVDWGFRGERELEDYGADHIVYRPEDILELLD